MIYTASTLSLAALELLVHVDSDLIPSDLTAFCLEAPDRLFTEHIAEAILPRGWRSRPDRCRSLGDTWAREHRSAILAVPSAVVPTESNYLINPLHPDAGHVQVVERRGFSFDPRLF